jgi:hypothetical protein
MLLLDSRRILLIVSLNSVVTFAVANAQYGEKAILSVGWHHVRLTFQGSNITALLDSKELIAVRDESHARGMIALGCDWSSVQFDNLGVAPDLRNDPTR